MHGGRPVRARARRPNRRTRSAAASVSREHLCKSRHRRVTKSTAATGSPHCCVWLRMASQFRGFPSPASWQVCFGLAMGLDSTITRTVSIRQTPICTKPRRQSRCRGDADRNVDLLGDGCPNVDIESGRLDREDQGVAGTIRAAVACLVFLPPATHREHG